MEPDQDETRRLFIGLRVASETAERLVRRVRPTLVDEDGQPPEGLTLYGEEDLHLTLCFLGAVDAGRAAQLVRVLQEEVRGLVSPELWLCDTGGFPDLTHPRVLWAGVRETEPSCGRLLALHNRAVQAGLSIGWRPGEHDRGRPFRPHVTLARVRRDGPEVHEAFGRLTFDQRWLPVDVELLESRPGDPEGRYHTLSAVPLVVLPG